ncbi:hypothetical protein HRG_014190 [Hirsutella rhossiliensis]
MIGVDACQRSFCIAFAFLSGEDENDYIWALDQLQSIYELYDIRQPSEKLVKAWVDQYAHFGNVATSGWKASTHY